MQLSAKRRAAASGWRKKRRPSQSHGVRAKRRIALGRTVLTRRTGSRCADTKGVDCSFPRLRQPDACLRRHWCEVGLPRDSRTSATRYRGVSDFRSPAGLPILSGWTGKGRLIHWGDGDRTRESQCDGQMAVTPPGRGREGLPEGSRGNAARMSDPPPRRTSRAVSHAARRLIAESAFRHYLGLLHQSCPGPASFPRFSRWVPSSNRPLPGGRRALGRNPASGNWRHGRDRARP